MTQISACEREPAATDSAFKRGHLVAALSDSRSMEMALNIRMRLRLLTCPGCRENAGRGACQLRGSDMEIPVQTAAPSHTDLLNTVLEKRPSQTSTRAHRRHRQGLTARFLLGSRGSRAVTAPLTQDVVPRPVRFTLV